MSALLKTVLQAIVTWALGWLPKLLKPGYEAFKDWLADRKWTKKNKSKVEEYKKENDKNTDRTNFGKLP